MSACGSKPETDSAPTEEAPKIADEPTKAEETPQNIDETSEQEEIRQEVVNICCDYSNCDSIMGFEIGTQKLVKDTGIQREYELSGSYYPVDAYGDIGDKYLFDITMTVNKISGWPPYVVSYQNIRKK